MKILQKIIELHWQKPIFLLSVLLFLPSCLFAFVASLRRLAYQKGWLKQWRVAVPVVVVGNIQVGGTGKTPIVMALVECLKKKGIAVGVISRGYGRKSSETFLIQSDSDSSLCGDEPLLVHLRTEVPVAVGKTRVAAAHLLLEKYPNIQLIISDDGLQHYALYRDFEIAVFPVGDLSARRRLLPNGHLREPFSRLNGVDALIYSGITSGCLKETLPEIVANKSHFCAFLQYGAVYALNNPQKKADKVFFNQCHTVALCAIARPQRFFDALAQLGIDCQECIALPDHAPLGVQVLPEKADCIIISEKDAVKLAGLTLPHVWVLPVYAIIEPDISTQIEKILG